MAISAFPDDPQVDPVDLEKVYYDFQIQTLVIAIGGTGAPSPSSWKNENDTEIWLRALDPDMSLHLGIFSFPNRLGVDSRPVSWTQIETEGSLLLSALFRLIDANHLENCPIVLVAHSSGGFILKRAINIAFNSDQYRRILDKISCVVLLGCPHSLQKTVDSWKKIPIIFQLLSESKSKPAAVTLDLATGLGGDCFEFESAFTKGPVISLYETRPSKRPGLFKSKEMLVPEKLARVQSVPGLTLPVDMDHRHLCCFSQQTATFRQLLEEIHRAINALPAKASVGLTDFRLVLRQFDQRSWVGPDQQGPFISNAGGTAGSTTASFQVIPALTDFPIVKQDPKLPCHAVPYGERRSFHGRSDVLNQLQEALLPSSENPGNPTGTQEDSSPMSWSSISDSCFNTVILCGPGGMGKSEVAIKFAHQHKDCFDAILWIQADEPAKMDQSFTEVAIELGFLDANSVEAQDSAQTKQLVLGWLSKPYRSFAELENEGTAEEASWLVIFDNVDNPDILDGSLPIAGSGSVLITSRDPLLIPYLPSRSRNIKLEPLQLAEATDLLLHLSGRRRSATREDCGDANSVAELLDGFPLAIAQMAGVIARDDLSFSEFKTIYVRDMQHQDLFNRNIIPAKTGYKHNLSSVWALETLKLSAVLLDCVSLLDPDGIPEFILDAEGQSGLRPGYPVTATDYEKARSELLHSSLISREKERKSIRIHRLIQDAARSRMSPETFNLTFSSTLLLLSTKWPYEKNFSFGNEISGWSRLDQLYPQVLRLEQHFSRFSAPAALSKFHLQGAKLALEAAWHSIMRSRFEETIRLIDMGKAMCQALMTDQDRFHMDREVLNDELEHLYRISFHHRGVAALHTNQPDVSLPNLRQFTDLLRRKHQGDVAYGTDQSLGIAWNELGNAYLQNGNTGEAEACFSHSIHALRALDESDEYSISMPLINLGFAYWVGNKPQDALRTFQKALADREKELGKDDKTSFVTGKLLLGYGNVHLSLGNIIEAFDLHQRCLKQYRSTVGDNHHRTADACIKVAFYYAQIQNFSEAKSLLDQALKVWSTHAHFIPERARAHYHRGKLLLRLHKENEAEDDFSSARALWNLMYPDDVREVHELTDAEFDSRIMFWSR